MWRSSIRAGFPASALRYSGEVQGMGGYRGGGVWPIKNFNARH